MSDKFQEKGLFENIQWFSPDPKHHRCRGPRNRMFMSSPPLTAEERAQATAFQAKKERELVDRLELEAEMNRKKRCAIL